MHHRVPSADAPAGRILGYLTSPDGMQLSPATRGLLEAVLARRMAEATTSLRVTAAEYRIKADDNIGPDGAQLVDELVDVITRLADAIDPTSTDDGYPDFCPQGDPACEITGAGHTTCAPPLALCQLCGAPTGGTPCTRPHGKGIPTCAEIIAADERARRITGLISAPVAATAPMMRSILRALVAADVVWFKDDDGFEIDTDAAPTDIPRLPLGDVGTEARIFTTLADLVATGEATLVAERSPNGLFPMRPAAAASVA